MPPLRELAVAIKSQNSGATHYAFAVMFADPSTHQRVLDSGSLTAERVAQAYRIPAGSVEIHDFAPACSIVISFPRPTLNGNPDDTDIDGAQQHVPLMNLVIEPPERP